MEPAGKSLKAILDGDSLALARLITKIENQEPDGLAILDDLFPYTGRAHLIGITGSPGSGKSTLVNLLVQVFRKPGQGCSERRVGVVAVDPSSPFSGGALLGDRVRMRDLMADPGVFIRSMASRGALGGLAYMTAAVVQALDAAGFEWILIETVGAGQTEVDVARLAQTVIVVEAPGMGDDIQAIKAGILEIADILVVNKSDRSGAENTVRSLRSMLGLARPDVLVKKPDTHQHSLAVDALPLGKNIQTGWITPLIQTIAIQGIGAEELVENIFRHIEFLEQSKEGKRRDSMRIENEFHRQLQDAVMHKWKAKIPNELYQNCLQQLIERQISPRMALDRLVGSVFNAN